MRIGLFGGTFDPVHLGHLVLAEQCREQCELDEVWFIPAGRPPHKTEQSISSGKIRAEMLEFATAGHAQFRVNQVELQRDELSFTVDTLRRLKSEDPSRELFFLIGADSLIDLPKWREPEQIGQLCTIVAVNRPGSDVGSSEWVRQHLPAGLFERIIQVAVPGIEISSRDLRQRIQSGRSIRYMVPRAVETYIMQHGLYRTLSPD